MIMLLDSKIIKTLLCNNIHRETKMPGRHTDNFHQTNNLPEIKTYGEEIV